MELSAKQRTVAIILIIMLGGGMIFVMDGMEAETLEQSAGHIEVKEVTPTGLRADTGAANTEAPVTAPITAVEETPADAPVAALTDGETSATPPVGTETTETAAPTASPVTQSASQTPPDTGDGTQCTSSQCQTLEENAKNWDASGLQAKLKEAQKGMLATIRKDYGDYFEKIFLDTQPSFEPVNLPGNRTLETLQRKIMIKILRAQLTQHRKESQVPANCQCDGAPAPTKRFPSSHSLGRDSPEDAYMETFVWVTGGHSSAAGHGNLYNESYTAYLSRDLEPVFASLGIEFVGRNYGMGGTSSPEIALCIESIFGSDTDLYSWDYGMTDGKKYFSMAYFAYIGTALLPNFPISLVMHENGFYQRRQSFKDVEDLGAPVLVWSVDAANERKAAFPDSAELPVAEVQNLPPYLRYLVCSGQLEMGDGCVEERYSKYVCETRGKKANWHPGYKLFATEGHALSIRFSRYMLEAMSELVERTKDTSPYQLLLQLEEEQQTVRQEYLQKPPPLELYHLLPTYKEDTDKDRKEGDPFEPPPFDETFLWQGPRLCRTARLPAESRYLGYTTNTDKVGKIAVLGQEEFDVGMNPSEWKTALNTTGELVLTKSNGKQEHEECEVVLKPDYKDYFFAHYDYGWSSLTIPNEKEIAAYNYDPDKVRGLIAVVWITCDYNKCPPGSLREKHVPDGDLEIKVNGKPVTRMIGTRGDAQILKGKSGVFWEKNAQGGFEISFKVNVEDAHIRVSSILIF